MNKRKPKPITCSVCGVEKCSPCGQFVGGSIDYKTRTGVCKGCAKGQKPVIEVYSSGRGIGDTISALYAVWGMVKAGHKVRYHAKNYDWLSRVKPIDGLEIVREGGNVGVDMNANYTGQLRSGVSRKQWYCDNLARGLGLDSFSAAVPEVDKVPGAKVIDAEKYVILSPFSAYTTREWPKSHWQRLADLIYEAGCLPVALGGAGNAQQRRLEDYFSVTKAVWFWGQSAEWVQDAMLHAEAVIGNDSGMVHVASLLGVKSVAIHAQISPEALWDCTDVIPVFSGESCAGCAWDGAKGWRKSCDNAGCSALMGITPSSVMTALRASR